MESIGGNISGDQGDDCSIALFAVLRSCWSARTDKPESINREDSPSIHFFLHLLSPALRVALVVTGALHEDYSLSKFPPLLCVFAYRGGVSFSSRNSSILLTSTFTSPLKVTKGGLVPGARSCRSAGFLAVQFQGGTFSVAKASTGVSDVVGKHVRGFLFTFLGRRW